VTACAVTAKAELTQDAIVSHGFEMMGNDARASLLDVMPLCHLAVQQDGAGR
jgi:hypothetical protein